MIILKKYLPTAPNPFGWQPKAHIILILLRDSPNSISTQNQAFHDLPQIHTSSLVL